MDFPSPVLVPQFGAFDWILFAVAMASLMIGAWRGLVFEVLSLLSWIAAFVVAQGFAGVVGAWLPMGEGSDAMQYAAGFVLVFLITIFACNLIASLLKKMVMAVGLRPVDRVLGAVFGVARAGVLVLVIGVIAQLTPVGAADWWVHSVSGPLIGDILNKLRPVLPDGIGKLISA